MSIPSNVARHPAATQRLDNVIAIASGKGGVGKTWLSITLAHALAAKGHRMLLFDGDLGLANIDVQLGLMPAHDIASVIAGKANLDDAINTYDRGGFDILAGRSGSGGLAALTPQKLKGLHEGLASVAGRYDLVILDLAAGLDQNLRLLAGLSGTCLVMTTDEPTALTDAYALIKVLTVAGRQGGISIVVNLATSHKDGERTYTTLLKACESFLKISPPLAGVVCRDDRVPETIRRQAPTLTRHPTSEAADDVNAIAAQLLKDR
jgi:flagellar biosynthesis protein FlhG